MRTVSPLNDVLLGYVGDFTGGRDLRLRLDFGIAMNSFTVMEPSISGTSNVAMSGMRTPATDSNPSAMAGCYFLKGSSPVEGAMFGGSSYVIPKTTVSA